MAFLGAAAAIALVGSVPALGRSGQSAPRREQAAHVPGELLVRFKSSATAADRARVRRLNRARVAERLWTKALQRLELPPDISVKDAVAAFGRRPEVVYAEPNAIYRTQVTPNDPSFARQWGLQNNGGVVRGIPGVAGADIEATRAWDVTTGSRDVVVGVVDTGIAFDHRDLAANTRPRLDWEQCTTPPPAGPNDRNGHGTHVAGIIGAEGNNGIGTAGVSWRVSLLPEKALSDDGSGTADDVAEAFNCAARRGAKVVNASLGGGQSHVVAEAVSDSPNTLFVVAAGNRAEDVDDGGSAWPCQLTNPNLICVAATDQNDELARFSNWGEVSVDIAAPGADVLSTHPARDEFFFDHFETDIAGRWVAPQFDVLWQRTTDVYASPSHALYTPVWIEPGIGSSSVAEIAQPFAIEGRKDCRVDFWARLNNGNLRAEYRTDNWSWSNVGEAGGTYVRNLSGYINEHYAPNTRVRFVVWRDTWGSRDRSVAIDDVRFSCRAEGPSSPSYEFLGGTSMAAPQVTGVAALLFAKHPLATPVQVKNAILDGADRLPSLEGKLTTGGRLNAHGALTVPLRDDARVEVGNIRTVAGSSSPTDPHYPANVNGAFYGDGGPAVAAGLNHPLGIADLGDGGYLIADNANHRVRRVASDGTITTVAGSGVRGFAGDGGPAVSAQLGGPSAISLTREGGFLIADSGNSRVRKVSAAGTITTVAGNGDSYAPPGDGGPATEAALQIPTDVAALPDGGFLIAEYQEGAVRRVWPDGTITTVVGPQRSSYALRGVSLTSDGGFVYSEHDRVKRYSPGGAISVVAGNGKAGFGGDFGPAAAARLSRPSGVLETPDGGFLIADDGNERIRRVSPDGTITTVAGTAIRGFAGDGGPASAARLQAPHEVALTADGGFLIADTLNHRIRLVESYAGSRPGPPSTDPGPPGPAGPRSPQPVPVGERRIESVSPRRLLLTVTRRGAGLSSLLERGVRLTIACPEACDYDARLALSSRLARKIGLARAGRLRVIGRRRGRLAANTRTPLWLTVTRRARAPLLRARRVRVTVLVQLRDLSGRRLLATRRQLDFRR